MKIKKAYYILLLLVTQLSFAQDGIPIYSDYFADNLYLLHPSMAGAATHNQVRLTARQQWFDQDEAPNLQTLSYNYRCSGCARCLACYLILIGAASGRYKKQVRTCLTN